MDDSVVNVTQLSGQFTLEVLENLKKENELLKAKLRHLEGVLLSQKDSLVLRITPEEQICIKQIEILNNRSMERELNLEEVKKLDLYIKNLKLIRQEANMIVESTKSNKLSEAELLALVSSQE